MEERTSWLWLANALHYNPKQIAAVCRAFSSPQTVYGLPLSELKSMHFLSNAEQEALADKDISHLKDKIKNWIRSGIWVLTPADPGYPEPLRSLSDRPAVLFGRGKLPDFSTVPLTVAITGTRHCSRYGTRITPQFARTLAEAGTLIVSGLSEGIETIAADNAERAGGTVLAVMAGGVDQIYPRSNRALYERVLDRGAVVAEFPPGTPPLRHLMPYRNRLLSGFSDAVLVIEAGHRSGTRITTDYAEAQGRDVLAVPGSIDNEKCVGTNRLIQNGAGMVLGVDDIFLLYQSRFQNQPKAASTVSAEPRLTGAEAITYQFLDRDEPIGFDLLTEKTGLPVSVLNLVLTQLEIAGHISRLPGNRIVRK